MSIRLGALCLLLFLSGSCKNRLEKHGEYFSDLMKNPDGLFRGIHLGDNQDELQQNETGAPVEINETSIVYEVPIGSSGNCRIVYGIENNSVFEILAEASFEHQQDGLELLAGFREYFNEIYGPYEKERGNLVWKVKGHGIDAGTILEMTDESEYADFGLWTLSIYKPGSTDSSADSITIN